MQYLATTNLAKRDIFNMMQFELTKIDHDSEGNLLFMFGDKIFEHSVFAESFIPAFCVTVYKYQGGTINKPYNIFDVHKMDKKQLYTSLSRTTNLEYIQLSNKKLKYNDKIYVGGSLRKLQSRLQEHKTDTKSTEMIIQQLGQLY